MKKGLTSKQTVSLTRYINDVFKLDSEQKIDEESLKHSLYVAGLYLYRAYNKLGAPIDIQHPSVNDGKLTPLMR